MLISPAEPRRFYSLGTVSSICEKKGFDFLIPSVSYGLVGVQRKTILDLAASVEDGRLAKEVRQAEGVGLKVLLLEGRVRWTDSGVLDARGFATWTRTRHLATVWSLSSRGWWTHSTSDVEDSCTWLVGFEAWLKKPVDEHSTLMGRPSPPKNVWGTRESRDWAIWLIQSFEGIGAKTAASLYDHFGGLPIMWTVTEEELREVPGIGKSRAKTMYKALKAGGVEKDIVGVRTTAEWLT